MPRRTILSASQRAAFEALPTEPEDLVRHWTLSEDDLALVQERRRARNRLGLAVQLCLVRYPGRALRSGEELPAPMIDFVAEQTGGSSDDFGGYAHRDQTRREHLALLIRHFHLSTFTGQHFRDMVRWLVPIAEGNPKSVLLMGAVLNELRRRCILHPSLSVVERIVATAGVRAERQIFERVNAHLSAAHREMLDAWLSPTSGQSQSRFAWVRQPIGRPSPAHVMGILEKLSAIDDLKLSAAILDELSPARQRLLAQEGMRASASHLREFGPARRYATLSVCLLETRRSLMDDALTQHDRIVGGLMRRSQRKHADQLQEDARRIQATMGMFSILGKALIQARETGEDLWRILDARLSWEELCTTIGTAESLSESRRSDYLQFVESNYYRVRRYAPAFLEHFDFRAAAGGQDVLDAIALLRDLNRTGRRKLPDDSPTSFVSARWEPYVYGSDGLDRRYYELCALSELRNRLRSGDIFLPGSRQYQDFDGYLMGRSAFRQLRDAGDVPVAVETDFAAYMKDRQEHLRVQLDEFERLVRQDQLEDVAIRGARLSIRSYRGISVPKEAKRFAERVYAKLPRTKITDLLVEVDRWTGFTEQFTHLRTGQPTQEKQALLTVILSDGINLGLTRMAEACPGTSAHQLIWTADWYVREECYSRALAEIINHHHRIPLTGHWGDGSTSSSDGQQFPLGSTGKALGQVNARYGRDPGVIFYTHVSDQYAPFHTQLINATARDATYVLDGLLYHESNLDIEEHYTDTTGFTDHVFALCHLLGFRFAPRIRDIGDMQLYSLEPLHDWPNLKPLFGGTIRTEEIKTQWEDVLRLVSSIRLGTVTASLIIRKLASYPRQNRLALAMRELGRLERTLFILDWAKNPTLRGRIQAGLNKGEARNALARAVFFNRLGQVRDRSFENQCYRASGLNLVVAAIILWNTLYLEKAIAETCEEQDVPDEYLRFLSPLGWDHISLTGDYRWNLNPTP